MTAKRAKEQREHFALWRSVPAWFPKKTKTAEKRERAAQAPAGQSRRTGSTRLAGRVIKVIALAEMNHDGAECVGRKVVGTFSLRLLVLLALLYR